MMPELSKKPFIIAIDGPAAAGKGSIAEMLRAELGLEHLNTGALYRLVALKASSAGIAPEDSRALGELIDNCTFEDLDNPDLYTLQVGELASLFAAKRVVREALLNIQRKFPQGKPGAIVEGRDIGTVIFPDAQAKIYITANDSIRAERRLKQLQSLDEDVIHEQVLAYISERDLRDSSRELAPLKKEDDYLVLDTSGVPIELVFKEAFKYVRMAALKVGVAL